MRKRIIMAALAPLLLAGAALAGSAGAGTPASREQAGTVVVAVGAVTASGADGAARALADGDTLYSGDTVTTPADGYATLDFEDGGNITLRPSTAFQVVQFHFDAADHDDAVAQAGSGDNPVFAAGPAQPESAVFTLLKGGLRAVSGLIGHLHQDDYRMSTPTVTIGIRGTEYDARFCQDDCADEAENGQAPENGVYTTVNKGSIALKNDSGETLSAAGQSFHVAGRGVPFRRLEHPPPALRHMELPRQYQQRAVHMRKEIHAERERRQQQQRVQRRKMREGQGTAGRPRGRYELNTRPGRNAGTLNPQRGELQGLRVRPQQPSREPRTGLDHPRPGSLMPQQRPIARQNTNQNRPQPRVEMPRKNKERR